MPLSCGTLTFPCKYLRPISDSKRALKVVHPGLSGATTGRQKQRRHQKMGRTRMTLSPYKSGVGWPTPLIASCLISSSWVSRSCCCIQRMNRILMITIIYRLTGTHISSPPSC